VTTLALDERCPPASPGPRRDAARLLRERFAEPLVLGSDVARDLPEVLSRRGIAGGATYDALVALAAVAHDAELATRDARARATYEAVGARVVVAA
jgi:toxin FitB